MARATHVPCMAEALGVPMEHFAAAWSRTRLERDTGALDVRGALRRLRADLGFAEDDALEEKAWDCYRESLRSILVARPGALETLAALRASRRRIGLLSDAPPEVGPLWTDTAMAPHFDAVVFSYEIGNIKPDPRVYAAICGRLRVAPIRCAYVANGERDELAGATRAGMRAVLFMSPGERPGPEAVSWSGHRLSDLAELLTLLD